MVNIPEAIYTAADFCIRPVVYLLVPKADIERRLRIEQRLFKKTYVDYALEMLAIIHDRAGSMVSHLSLMLAMCLFLLQGSIVESTPIERAIVLADTFMYIILVILSVRCLRSFGLDKDRVDIADYESHMETELTLKFAIMQVVNAFTILATIILVLALMIIKIK
jgi:hypothetical protein